MRNEESQIVNPSADAVKKEKSEQTRPETKQKFFDRFKERWEIKSNWSVVLILIAFSINGSIAVWVAKPVLAFFNVNSETMNPWLYYPVRIGLILPIYQMTLVPVGTALGQFKFFWAFQKKTVGRMFGHRPSRKK